MAIPSPAAARTRCRRLGPLNTVLKIELDGANAPGNGLELHFFNESIDSSNSRIDGLAINRFSGDGIKLDSLSGGNTIAGSFIGTDVSGTIDLGNRGDGIYVDLESGDTIGGTTAEARNLVSANDDNGMRVFGAFGASIVGNVIGADRIAAFALPNGSAAILFTDQEDAGSSAAGQRLPSVVAEAVFSPNQQSVPAAQQGRYESLSSIPRRARRGDHREVLLGAPAYLKDGVEYKDDVKKFEQARPTSNDLTPPGNVTTAAKQFGGVQALLAGPPAFLGFDLGGDGVTPNDLGDLDDGPNGLQNFPVLQSAATVNGSTTIVGTLNSLALRRFRIDLYSSSYDTDVIRAGEQFLGSVEVTADAAGNASFAFTSPIAVPVGQHVISTATTPRRRCNFGVLGRDRGRGRWRRNRPPTCRSPRSASA